MDIRRDLRVSWPDEDQRANHAVNHPAHYNANPSGIECIDVVEHLPFNIGNAIKYLWRCDGKGNALEDLQKARWYIEREIARRSKARQTQSIPPDALCAVEGCGHRYDDHGYNGDYCDVCLHEEDGSFHHFARKPYVCGAATPSQEREAYDKAMRGEL